MDYHLKKETHLIENSETKGLYSWSLQEFDKDGSKDGNDQIPWEYSLYFTASELRLTRSIKFERTADFEEENKPTPIEESEIITAILHPGVCNDGQLLQKHTSFSMFGTDRYIKHFDLKIFKLKDGDAYERCKLWGSVSFTYEIDFCYKTTDDAVEIYIWLSPQRFNSLAEIIKMQRADLFQVSLDNVTGFYSEWSPDISTDIIKILARKDDQKIIFPEGCNITPPELGEVGQFELSIIQRNKINPKQDLRSIDIYKLFEENDDVVENTLEEDFSEREPDVNSLLLAQLLRNEHALTMLRTPLWLIFILLLLLFLKVVL